MTGLMKANKVSEYLDKLIPDARCELNYKKDYELLMAVMLSAQTTDKRVNMVTSILFDKYPSLESIKEADIKDIQNIIRPIGTYTKKAKNLQEIATRLLEEQNGVVPNDRDFLESLSGVGRKTTNVVLANLFNEPFIAVDTHVSRVSKRLGFAKESDNPLKIEEKLNKKFPKNKLNRLHHQLVLFGRYYCKAQNPSCDNCELKEICKYKKNRD